MGIKKGSAVTQVVPVIRGEVQQTRYNEDKDCKEHLVAYKGADGEDHTRWFLEPEELTEDGAEGAAS